MNSTITTRKDMNGPLGAVTSIVGDDAHMLIRLMMLRSALKLYAEHNIKASRLFSMKLVKQTTQLTTNDKAAQLAKLDAMIETQRTKVTFIEESAAQ